MRPEMRGLVWRPRTMCETRLGVGDMVRGSPRWPHTGSTLSASANQSDVPANPSVLSLTLRCPVSPTPCILEPWAERRLQFSHSEQRGTGMRGGLQLAFSRWAKACLTPCHSAGDCRRWSYTTSCPAARTIVKCPAFTVIPGGEKPAFTRTQ